VTRGIDHLVVAVRDLDTAGRFYERLGFRVGSRNRHPWGTENRLIQFPGSFIELISVGEGASIREHAERGFSFGAFVRDYLVRREGLAMLVLDSRNAEADATLFSAAGIGDFEPFHFARQGTLPNGTEIQVAFTLAFARDPEAPELGFFVCQQHFPESFWNPEFQDHPNRAVALSRVALATPDPDRHFPFLTALTGTGPSISAGPDRAFELTRGRIDVMVVDDAAETYGSIEADANSPSFVAFAVRIDDVERQALHLDAAGIPYQRIGSRIVVPASSAFGVALAFEPG
jgi:catechol 2,3-dioxygenase-like lactoylglutathione lyase family enzyme